MRATLLSTASRVLWRLIERNGIDPEFVFREAGLDPSLLDDPRARYGVENARTAWHEAARLIENPCFGLQAAEEWRPTDFHALGYSFLASRTLRTAIERIERYNAVVDPIIYFEDELDDAHLRLTYRIAHTDLLDIPALQDARWAVVLGMCREVYGQGLDPTEVAFTHAAPSCQGDYFGLFRCPVHFDAPVPQLVFDREQVEHPLPAANLDLARANDAVVSAYITQLQKDDIVSLAKSAIIEHLPSGAPSAEMVAKDLCVSPRTLQRRLAEVGTSYSEVLETVRRALAEQYITDPSRSLSEITYLLGFSELSAFSRAFRRWTGQAPSAVRDSTTA